MKLLTYVNYGGNCREAFRFYEAHLGGKITMMMTHGEQPNPNEAPSGWKDKILHARMNLGETELLGSDVPPERFQPMRSVYLSLILDSVDEAERVYGTAVRWRPDLHADRGDFLCLPVRHAAGQVRHFLDASPRTFTSLGGFRRR